MTKHIILKIGEWYKLPSLGICRLELYISKGIYMIYQLKNQKYLYAKISDNLETTILPRRP